MIGRIIEFSARNPLIVILLTIGALAGGWWCLERVPLDAIPDLSDTQVIVASRWDRSPDIMEDQVTYPIVTAMMGAPRVKAVRGFSDFGYSYVYIIFEEGTELYWARSRTLEYLSSTLPRLPQGVSTELGPDATGVGWVFQYALVDPTGKHSLADLRSYQDWYLRYYLKSVPGVADVAPIGGFVRQYQVNVDPFQLQAYSIPLEKVVDVVRKGNNDVGGRLVEFTGAEYMVRGRGYVRNAEDIGNLVLSSYQGVPVRVSDVGAVTLGPDLRRGVADLDGKGDVVSGIVIMRQGENALQVIQRVKQKLEEIEPGLPAGVRLITAYDRSELILSAIRNLKITLAEELLVVCAIILIFLWHFPSAVIPILTIPIAVIVSFIPMKALGISSNVMSLGGIAIAVGALVDAAIVVVEQTHKKLDEWQQNGRPGSYAEVVIGAVKEVGGASFYALLVIGVSFTPVLALEAQEGRLFKPLAYTKNLSMIVAAILAVTLDPALRLLFTHARNFRFRPVWLCRAANALVVGTIHSEDRHPISRLLISAYRPVCLWTLRHPRLVLGSAVTLLLISIPPFLKLGSEFMPPLDEQALFYMPSTAPGISVAEAQRLLQLQDKIISGVPEVERVMGKAGRAETSTDPAPLSMMETIIQLKPKTEWRKVSTWYSSWAPPFLCSVLRHITPDHISTERLIEELNDAARIPGVTNAWTMPIRARIDMLTTNVRTPVGIKVSGADIQTIEDISIRIESLIKAVRGTRSAYAERAAGGYFLDVSWNREQMARFGVDLEKVQTVLASGVGGENVTTTVEGRERYPVNVRFMRDARSDIESLRRIPVVTTEGAQIPIASLADIRLSTGPSMLRDENGLLTGYVSVDVAGRDLGGYVEEARRVVAEKIKTPPGYSIQWSGQYEALARVRERLKSVVPLTLFLIFVLLYLNTRSTFKTIVILLAVPFSAVGAVWLLYLLGYNMSAGVWVGLIALLGVDAGTGVFMLLYLDLSYEQARREGRLGSLAELREAVVHGAVKRIRPKFMTVATTFVALVPILWSTGVGSDVMKRIAAPMVGGILTSFLLELLVYPVIYERWKWRREICLRPGCR